MGHTHPLTAPRVLPDVVADLGAGGGALVGLPGIQAGAGVGTGGHCRFRGWPSCVASSPTHGPSRWMVGQRRQKFGSPTQSTNLLGLAPTRSARPPPLDRACIDIQSGPEHEPGRLGRPLDEGNKSPDTRVAGMTFAATATSVVDDSRHEKHGAGKPLQQEVPPIHGAGQWRKLPK